MSDFELGIGSDGSDLTPSNEEGEGTSESLANPFLSKIPENDREIVGKYIKDWDAGVTRKFQQIHEQYRPYKDLGVEPNDLGEAWALQQMIQEDPQRVYDLLGQIIATESGQGEQQSGAPGYENFGEDLPPAFIEKFTRMEGLLEQLAGQFLQSQEAQQEQQEDAELDDYLQALHQQFGDFDEDWVLSKMMKGVDGDKAVQQYNAFLQEAINSRMSSRRPVPVLGGGGAVPTNGVDPTKLNRNDTQALVAKMLADAAGQQ